MAISGTLQDYEFQKFVESPTRPGFAVPEVSVAITIPAPAGKSTVALFRNDYSGTPVTTAAYVEVVSSLSDIVNQLYIFDSSGQTLYLAVGAAASEVDQMYIVPGGNGEFNLRIASGSRVSIKAVSGNATVGEISITFLK